MGFREKKPHERTRQRKLGELLLVSEQIPERANEPDQRILSGLFDVDTLIFKCREVRTICVPYRDFIRLKIPQYFATWNAPERYSLIAFDTNAHGLDSRGYRTIARPKRGNSYKRPSHDLCPAGHVPICWGYRGERDTFYAALSGVVITIALRELAELTGGELTKIDVRLQMVSKPGDSSSKRTFMSWGVA